MWWVEVGREITPCGVQRRKSKRFASGWVGGSAACDDENKVAEPQVTMVCHQMPVGLHPPLSPFQMPRVMEGILRPPGCDTEFM